MLHRKKAKVDVKDQNGDTALHWAVAMESLSLVRFIVEELGIAVDIPNAVSPAHTRSCSWAIRRCCCPASTGTKTSQGTCWKRGRIRTRGT